MTVGSRAVSTFAEPAGAMHGHNRLACAGSAPRIGVVTRPIGLLWAAQFGGGAWLTFIEACAAGQE
jgi:hypothetical protein